MDPNASGRSLAGIDVESDADREVMNVEPSLHEAQSKGALTQIAIVCDSHFQKCIRIRRAWCRYHCREL